MQILDIKKTVPIMCNPKRSTDRPMEDPTFWHIMRAYPSINDYMLIYTKR